jgi:hypothetical protein
VTSQGLQIDTSDAKLEILFKNYTLLSEYYKDHIKKIYKAMCGVEKKLKGVKLPGVDPFDFLTTGAADAATSVTLQDLREKVEHLTGATNQHVGHEPFESLVSDGRALGCQVQGSGLTGQSRNTWYFQAQLDQMSKNFELLITRQLMKPLFLTTICIISRVAKVCRR